MNALPTLLWLEFKRTAWVIYASLIGLAVFALILLSLPGVVTGLDVMNLPLASSITESETDCIPPDCVSSGRSSARMSRESRDGSSSFSWSFSRTWGSESEPGSGPPVALAQVDDDPTAAPSVIPVAIPEELQIAIRPRQAVTAATTVGLTGLMLLGFWISHAREADRGEMVMLYQSPVSGEIQLSIRFLYMGGTATVALLMVLAIYWTVQTSQSLAPLAPIVEAFGARVHLHWGSLALTVLTTCILPNTAFALLFIQMRNAYDLLGGRRLIGFVLVLSALALSARSLFRAALDPEPPGAVLHVMSVVSNPTLDTVVPDFAPGQLRLDVPLEVIAMGAGISILMLVLSGRIWREVEWS